MIIKTNPNGYDHPDCFVCGEPASRDLGSLLTCDRHPEGLVRWSKNKWATGPLRSVGQWHRRNVTYVDFTQPDAPSAPA